MLVRSALLTFGQIGDPVFRGVVIKSVILTLCLFAGLTLIFYMARPDVTYFEWEWLNSALEVGGFLVFFAILVLTFLTVMLLRICGCWMLTVIWSAISWVSLS